jgi:hypothetical protein
MRKTPGASPVVLALAVLQLVEDELSVSGMYSTGELHQCAVSS